MWGLISTQIIISVLFLIVGWAVRYKKAYYLISGFSSRSKMEQQHIIANGLPQKTGSLLITTACVMLILLPLHFTSFLYNMEIQFGSMLVILLGGFIYLSKYEIPSKRKRSFTISISLFIIVLGSITALSVFSYQGYEMTVLDDRFEITGMYGNEWSTKDIKQIELIDEMPKIITKTNGVGLPTLAKGYFKLNDFGICLLFIHNNSSPYIYIELQNEKIFINDSDPLKTKQWFEELRSKQSL
ncbi:DUF3784 domain-containing protein [Bacillus sp. S/N-304-OC-R1]|uniref:DUF3784 domain-containing protein n=1 Tax=Bacillus sp. S/N-304-OC-R1 TaxID=2758034 RepID=UPI001C8F06C7|nr:DUF3784 domain-containing protein [Bacillus sp. S/N-304-OC-R1]MBY0123018.1 DUF3784 domain-containing protein [Bacillus sp. S/N-304-OC-R1]